VDVEDVIAIELKGANMQLEQNVLFAARTRTATFKAYKVYNKLINLLL
jgi:hypothetical protein